jgi:hypothetical protein
MVREDDAGIVEEDVEARIVPGNLARGFLDTGGIGDVQLTRRRARISRDDFVEIAHACGRR